MDGISYHRSTAQVAPPEQFSYWREAITDAFVPLEPERDPQAAFAGNIDARMLPELRTSTITADAHAVRLTASGVARSSAAPFFVNLLQRGEALVHQGGQVRHARAGDIYVVDCGSPWEVSFLSDFQMFCVEVDESMLRPRLGRHGRLSTSVLEGNSGAGRALGGYLQLVKGLPEDDLGDMQSMLSAHCCDLVAHGQMRGIAADNSRDQLRAELRERIFGFMQRNMHDHDLCPDTVCAQLRISRSYLFKILALEGLTFRGYLRECRLLACRQALRSVPGRSIGEIAAAHGFPEVSSFNRAFRARFGQTPGQARGT